MVNNIKEVREEIWQSLSDVTDEQLNEMVEEGKWSIAQVLDHLYLIEHSAAGKIKKTLISGERQTVKLRRVELTTDRTVKVQAPEFWMPSSSFQTKDELKNKLNYSRKELLESIKGVSEEELNGKSIPHPIFGALSLNQWVSFIGYHEQRHLDQIEEIKRALKTK